MKNFRSLALALLTASALMLPTSAVAAQAEPDKVLTVGVDVAAGWLWSSGSPDGCSVSQTHDEGISFVSTSADEAKMLQAKPGGVLEITGCGTVTEVGKMAKSTKKKKVVGDGDWLVGPHFAPGGVYVGKPAKGSFWEGHGSTYCDWVAHKSFAAFEKSFMPDQSDGPLKVTKKMKVIETDGDCVWKRVR